MRNRLSISLIWVAIFPLTANTFAQDFTQTVMQVSLQQQTEISSTLSVNSLATESRVYKVEAINGAFLIRTGSKLICVGKP